MKLIDWIYSSFLFVVSAEHGTKWKEQGWLFCMAGWKAKVEICLFVLSLILTSFLISMFPWKWPKEKYNCMTTTYFWGNCNKNGPNFTLWTLLFSNLPARWMHRSQGVAYTGCPSWGVECVWRLFKVDYAPEGIWSNLDKNGSDEHTESDLQLA